MLCYRCGGMDVTTGHENMTWMNDMSYEHEDTRHALLGNVMNTNTKTNYLCKQLPVLDVLASAAHSRLLAAMSPVNI